MSVSEEEEETTNKPRGRGNAYFADRERTGDGFTGAYRGVKPVKRGGQQTVQPEDTHGSVEDCWCGQPFGHEWPGKAGGAPHPKGAGMNDQISAKHLRGYHADLQAFVVTAVNRYGLRHRMKANSLLLYPPDGTDPRPVYKRNTDRQIKALGEWWQKHCAPFVTEPEPKKVAEQADLEALAAALNNPDEHPDPPKVSADPVRPPAAKPTPPRKAAQAPLSPTRSGWVLHVKADGETSEWIETDGQGTYRCGQCVREGKTAYKNDAPSKMVGHYRTIHGDATSLWDEAAQDKKRLTYRLKKGERAMNEALMTLAAALDLDLEPPKVDKKAAASITALEAKVVKLEAALADEKNKHADTKARLDLIREAMRA